MTFKTLAASVCAAAVLAVPSSAFGSEATVTGDCHLGLPASQLGAVGSGWFTASAHSTAGSLDNPVAATSIHCWAYDTVTGALLGHLGQTLDGNDALVFGQINVPAGHGVRFETLARAFLTNGTCVSNPADSC